MFWNRLRLFGMIGTLIVLAVLFLEYLANQEPPEPEVKNIGHKLYFNK